MTKEQAPEVPVRFYRSATGREPVLEWLRSLDRHGFIKKTQKTPAEELELAKRRLKEITQ